MDAGQVKGHMDVPPERPFGAGFMTRMPKAPEGLRSGASFWFLFLKKELPRRDEAAQLPG